MKDRSDRWVDIAAGCVAGFLAVLMAQVSHGCREALYANRGEPQDSPAVFAQPAEVGNADGAIKVEVAPGGEFGVGQNADLPRPAFVEVRERLSYRRGGAENDFANSLCAGATLKSVDNFAEAKTAEAADSGSEKAVENVNHAGSVDGARAEIKPEKRKAGK
ncbi:MAG: hypothetical protein IKS15_05680 [Opitutales bacterium]|nr:hypothetical protein [Opitutales bacterium]